MSVCSVAPNQKRIYSYRMIAPRMLFFLLSFCFITQGIFPQEAAQAIPLSLRRPERGEAPRYPEDLVIGVLGQGEIAEEAYLFAKNLLSALAGGRRNAPVIADSGSFVSEATFEEVRSIRPRSHRLGGGRQEIDGCVSFLVRFVGPEESISGELFIRQRGNPEENGRWFLDDIILEDKRTLSEIRDSYRFDFTPYERFY